MADFTGFPICRDGDVLISLSTNRQLQLHSEILKRHSHFFDEHLQGRNAAELNAAAKKSGVTARWRFDLKYTPGMPGCGRLEPVILNGAGCAVSDNIAAGYFSAGKVPVPLFDYYEKVLGAIYNRPFNVENEGMAQLLQGVMGLLDVGEYLGCMHVLRRTVDSMLAEHGQDLYQSIASDPVEWGKLAMRIRSFTIIREAIIHMTGQWKSIALDQRKSMDQKLCILVEGKDEQLSKLKRAIETRLANWYPADLQRKAASATPSEHGRADYVSHIMDWMALHIWRQWFCHALINGWLRGGPDGGLTCYKMIAAGGAAYLTKDNVNDWHKNFEMSTRGKNNMAICVDRIKLKVKDIVQPLLKHESALNITNHPVKYCTCTSVERRDVAMLWEENALEWDQPAVALCGEDRGPVLAPQMTMPRSDVRQGTPKKSKTIKGIAAESTTPKHDANLKEPSQTKKATSNAPHLDTYKRPAEQETPKSTKRAKTQEPSTPKHVEEQGTQEQQTNGG